jgi:anthranilate phosphoribosyltransferase
MIRTAMPSPPAKLPALSKAIGRGPHGTRDLEVDSARTLFAAVLDNKVPPPELNALLLAYRIKGETVAELTGFVAALDARVARLEPPADRPRPVLLPTYNGARRLPNLTALLALLLKRYGVPVLLHGTAGEGSDFGRVATAAVLGELGVEPAISVTDAQQRLDNEGIAYAPIAVLAPALAGLLALRRRMGLRSSAHTLAKLIDPFRGAGFRVISISHPENLARIRDFLAASRADALLLRGTEGEPFANPRRQPQLEWFEAGVSSVLFESETGTLAALPALPATIDAAATAKWIAAALAGEVPIPLPILNQLACCLHGARASRSAGGSTGQALRNL